MFGPMFVDLLDQLSDIFRQFGGRRVQASFQSLESTDRDPLEPPSAAELEVELLTISAIERI
ncbi:MAG TPA: hypothetical protein VGJ13_13140 [Pseudonocardiaceae bacterium]|jgi:hypothetical protein